MNKLIGRCLMVSLCCIHLERTYAQSSLQGRIVDSVSLAPVPFATVIVKKENDQNAFSSISVNDSGYFRLPLQPGKYMLVVTAVGYQQKTIFLDTFRTNTSLPARQILLARDAQSMKAVDVVARKPVYEFGPGKIIYEVQQDVRALGKNAWEILRQAPLVSIHGFESIQLKGSTNFLLQLNGKTQQILSSNPAAFLQSIDHTQVERIEVITTPSSKYTAEGIAGIINIVTKKQLMPGVFGALSVGYDTYNNSSAGLNLYGKKGKVGYSFTGNGNLWRNGVYDYSLEQTIGNDKIVAQSTTTPKRDNMNLIGSLSYASNIRNTFNIDASLFSGSGQIKQLFSRQNTQTKIINELRLSNFSLSFDWEKKIDSISSFVASYKTEQQRNSGDIYYYEPEFSLQNQNSSAEHTVQVDYKRKGLEMGVKGIGRRLKSDLIRDLQLNDDYEFYQELLAGYITYSRSLRWFNLQAGVRAEYAHLRGQVKDKDRFFDEDYFQLFPTISLEKPLKKLRTNLSLSYTRRTSRPQLYYLNPFVNVTNPYAFNSGNASLLPEMSNNFEFRIARSDSKGNQHIINISYQRSADAIVQFLFPASDSALTSTFINFPSQHVWGLSYYANVTLFKKLQVGISNNLYHVNYPQTTLALNNTGYNTGTSGFYGSFGLSFSGTIFKKIRWASSNTYTLRDIYLQGHSRYFFYQDLTLIVPFLKNKLTAFCAFRQPLWSDYRFETSFSSEGFYQYSQNTTPQRRVFFGFRYGFGKQQQNVIRTRKKINNEDKKTKLSLENIK